MNDREMNTLQRWLHQWKFRHNPAPGPGFEPFQDRQGRTYWLKQGSGKVNEIVVWRLYYQGDQIGEANGLRFEDEENFDVGELRVEPDHQGRGLGAALLGWMEAEARQQGASIITGRVTEGDAKAFPGLLAWYRTQGYDIGAVDKASKRGRPSDVAQIRKALF